jgi:exodeoxyribonuclease VII small subunit
MSERSKRLETKAAPTSEAPEAPEAPGVEDALAPNWQYETTVSEIETIIEQIERGELPLADVFDQFAIAVQQLRQCEGFLSRQQQQVDLLIETLLDEPDPA